MLVARTRILRPVWNQSPEELAEPPVLYLGGDENVDFVLDLRRVPEARGAVRPAAYTDQTF